MKALVAKSPSNDTSTKSAGVKHRHTPVPKRVPFFTGTNQFIQTKSLCPCDGGCPRCSGMIQPKLTIGQPNDKYEQEADRVADRIMRMPEKKESLVNGHSLVVQRKAGCSSCGDIEEEQIQTKPIGDQITPLIQRQEDTGGEEEEEEEPVQPKRLSNKSPPVTTGLQNQIQSIKGGGQPLSASTRVFFEQRFGRDLSNVRVHSGSLSAGLAGSLSAKAFTKGNDVVFGAGQYSPGTKAGVRLLAHELTHVVQQGGGRLAPHLAAGAVSGQTGRPEKYAGQAQRANELKVRERASSSPVQRLGDLSQVPAGLSCPVASDSAEFVVNDVLFSVGSPTLTPTAIANSNDETGFRISSDDNTLRGNTANNSTGSTRRGDGFRIEGNDNTLSGNSGNGNRSDDVDVRNNTTGNTCTGNTFGTTNGQCPPDIP